MINSLYINKISKEFNSDKSQFILNFKARPRDQNPVKDSARQVFQFTKYLSEQLGNIYN